MRRCQLLALALVTAGCSGTSPAPSPPLAATIAPAASSAARDAGVAADLPPTVELTVLFTTDEHGWVVAHESEQRRWGGVGPLLARLVGDEQHCAPLRSSAATLAGTRGGDADRCAGSSTLLLSGGDNFTGPAISGHFRGASMAEAMARLGFAAAALGNHELDYGRDAFASNRALSGVRYVAANLVDDGAPAAELASPFLILPRAGIRVGIVGLATVDTPRVAVASRFAGVRFEDPETALARVMPELWQAGADVALLLAHECAAPLVPVLERHPEWQLSFVGVGHCHQEGTGTVAGAALVSSGWRLDRYARVRLRVDRVARGPRQAAIVEQSLREVSVPSTEPAPTVDAAFDARVAEWQAEVDRALGEVIGYSARGLKRDDARLGGWVVESWRRALKVDVAVTTRGSIRQELPAGPITLATLSSILPFENELVVARVPGAMLLAMLREPGTIAAGVRRAPDGSFTLLTGGKLRADARYRVATTDFLYGGGDRCLFRQADPNAAMTGIGWREPVIEWTRALGSAAARPLESLLPPPR